MRRLSLLVLLLSLTACSDYIASTRESIYGWCEHTPRYCNVNAVQR